MTFLNHVNELSASETDSVKVETQSISFGILYCKNVEKRKVDIAM